VAPIEESEACIVRKLIAVAAMLMAGWAVPAAAAEGIRWHETLDAALKASQESGKLVMLTLYTDWCGFCTKLKQETWPAEAVVEQAAAFECASVNPETTKGSERYDNGAYPRTLFLRADGEVVSEIPGFLPPEEFAAAMGRVHEDLEKLTEAETLAKPLAGPEGDLALALKIGSLYGEIGRTKDALHWLAPAYEGREALPEADRATVAAIYGLSLAADLQYENCLEVLQPFIEAHAAHEQARPARFQIALALAKTDRTAEARDLWQALVDENSEDWIGKASAHNVQLATQALGGQQ